MRTMFVSEVRCAQPVKHPSPFLAISLADLPASRHSPCAAASQNLAGSGAHALQCRGSIPWLQASRFRDPSQE